MKKLLLPLLAAALSGTATAQKGGYISTLRPLLGIQYSTVSGSGISTLRTTPGMNLGLLGTFRLPKGLQLEAGFIYTHSRMVIDRSIRWQSYITTNGTDWHLRENTLVRYLRMPATIIYQHKKLPGWYAGVGAGIALNIASSRSSFETSGQLSSGDARADRFMMESSLGLPFGAFGHLMVGRDVKLGNLSGGLRLEYSSDLTGWRYPTTTDAFERNEPYNIRSGSLSLNAYLNLQPKADAGVRRR